MTHGTHRLAINERSGAACGYEASLVHYVIGANRPEPVGPIATFNVSGKKPAFSLAPLAGSDYFDHAYVVEQLEFDSSGNITGVVLLNPWGVPSKSDYEITVPLQDFNLLFSYLFCQP